MSKASWWKRRRSRLRNATDLYSSETSLADRAFPVGLSPPGHRSPDESAKTVCALVRNHISARATGNHNRCARRLANVSSEGHLDFAHALSTSSNFSIAESPSSAIRPSGGRTSSFLIVTCREPFVPWPIDCQSAHHDQVATRKCQRKFVQCGPALVTSHRR